MIPRTKVLKVEDFPEQSDWIEPVLRAINDGSTQTSSALSKALTFGENFNATVQSVEVTLKDDWQTATLSNSWVAMSSDQAPQYRRVGDIVYLRGAMVSGSVSSSAFTLPTGYRPPATRAFSTTSGGAFGEFTVDSAGVVTPTSGTNTSFWLAHHFAVEAPQLANGAFPIRFEHKLKNGAKPSGCWLVAARDLTTGARSTLAASGYVAWSPNGTEVIIDNVLGLFATRKYSLTFLVVGG